MKKTLLVLSMAGVLSACGGGEESTSGSSGNNNSVNTSVSVRTANVDVKEGDEGFSTLNVNIQANRNADNDITITYLTEDGTAKAGIDYVEAKGSAIIRKGSRSVDVPVQIIGNKIHQSNRDFKFVISGVSGTGNISKGTADSTTVRITDDDPEPVARFVSERTMVTEGVGSVGIEVVLDRPSEKTTTVRLSLAGLATRDVDYRVNSTDIVFAPLAISAKYDVMIIEDNLVEGTEDIRIGMQSVVNGKAGSPNNTVILISGDLKLPDTGVTRFYNNGQYNSNSPDSEHPYQDASYGWDKDAAFQNNGYAGFVYQKIDFDGNPIAASRNDHTCVYDNMTGLTWEVKGSINPQPTDFADDKDKREQLNAYAAQNWRSKGNRYLWHSTDSKNNGGVIGGVNNKEMQQEPYVSENCAFPDRNHPLFVSVSSVGCTSHKYVEIYSKSGACGFKDWRLPSIHELSTIVNFEHGQGPIDADYFKDEHYQFLQDNGEVRYLSDTPSVDNSASVWCMNMNSKSVELCNKQSYHSIRLVRGPKL